MLLAVTQSVDNLFHSFIVLCENEYFLISNMNPGHLANRHLANRHLANGHFTNGHLANGHLAIICRGDISPTFKKLYYVSVCFHHKYSCFNKCNTSVSNCILFNSLYECNDHKVMSHSLKLANTNIAYIESTAVYNQSSFSRLTGFQRML